MLIAFLIAPWGQIKWLEFELSRPELMKTGNNIKDFLNL